MTIIGDAASVLERLRRARRVLVTAHRSPDGDAIGSELALAELARGLGLEVVIANRDQGSAGLNKMPGAAEILVGKDLPDDFPAAFDLVVTLECPDFDRPGFPSIDQLPILNIDHHRANDLYGEVNWVDEDAPAVGEMVWRLFDLAGIEPSPDAATCAFVALSTDTGDFRYSNATPQAFSQGSSMVSAGARPEVVGEWIHEMRTESSIRLLGESLRSLELAAGGRIAIISVDQEAFDRASASPADTEDIINHPRSIASVQVVAFLKKLDGQPVRVSFRSKGNLDVCAVAASYGGGGHTNASGCAMDLEMSEARSEVRRVLEEMLEHRSESDS